MKPWRSYFLGGQELAAWSNSSERHESESSEQRKHVSQSAAYFSEETNRTNTYTNRTYAVTHSLLIRRLCPRALDIVLFIEMHGGAGGHLACYLDHGLLVPTDFICQTVEELIPFEWLPPRITRPLVLRLRI